MAGKLTVLWWRHISSTIGFAGHVADLHFTPCMPCCWLLQKESVMVLISVLRPHCHSDEVIKDGKTKAGQQRYKCQNTDCPRYSFQTELL
jgi:hypothetical protein